MPVFFVHVEQVAHGCCCCVMDLPHALPHLDAKVLKFCCCNAGSAPLVAPGKREEVLDRFSCHTALCPDSMGFYTKVTALSKVAQISTAAAAVIALWYTLNASAGQTSIEAKPVAAIMASLILSAGMSQVFQWLLGQFQYVYKPQDLQKDLAKLTDLTAHLKEEPTVGYRP